MLKHEYKLALLQQACTEFVTENLFKQYFACATISARKQVIRGGPIFSCEQLEFEGGCFVDDLVT